MRLATSILLNVLANVVTLLISPLLVMAWIVRVRVLEARARRAPPPFAARPGHAPPRSHLRLRVIAGGGK